MPSQIKIERLCTINGYLTAVYHTPILGWRYSIVLQDGSFFQPYDLYSSAAEAYDVAKSIIELVVSCDRESTSSV